jgi:murein DD-endopeptidase MepM/ murein hydrolase activator NlpD
MIAVSGKHRPLSKSSCIYVRSGFMSRKYTLMLFPSDKMGKFHTLNTRLATLIFAVAAFFSLIIAFIFSMVLLYGAYSQNNYDFAGPVQDENAELKRQIALYNKQIEDLVERVAELDELEFKVRDLISVQGGNVALKPIAVGGKEIDVLREFSTAAALNEKEFFSNLDSALTALSYEVEKRELTLSDLATKLEEKRLVLMYTPTVKPVNGWLSSQFGLRLSPFTGRQTFHEGIDIAARFGADVHASAKGVVVFAGPRAGYGHMVAIDHGYGYMTRYGHNSSLTVKVGDKVDKGSIIAKIGSSGRTTGPHLHYEVLVNGIPVNPLKFIIE